MTKEKFEVIIEQSVVTTFHIVADNSDIARQIAIAGTREPKETRKGLKDVLQVGVMPPRYKLDDDKAFTKRYAILDTENGDDAIAEFKIKKHAELLCQALNEKEDAE